MDLYADFLGSSTLAKAIIETAIDGVIVINKQGTILMVNHAILNISQYSKSELIGQNINMMMPQPHQANHDEYINNYLETGKEKIIGVGRLVQCLRKDGTKIPIWLSINELFIDNKRLFTGIIHDVSSQQKVERTIKEINDQLEIQVTKRSSELSSTIGKLLQSNSQLKTEVAERKLVENKLRKAEQELNQALSKERELNELKSRFITMASHEFRTPLSTILSSISILELYQNSSSNQKAQKHHDKVKNAVNHLTAMLDDFADLSKVEENKVQLNYTSFSISSFIHSIINELNSHLKKGQKINYKHTGFEDSIKLDETILKAILINISLNAIKYSPEGKNIYLISEQSPDQLSITVRDEGMGIPKSDQQHIFSQFFRASNAINIQGTGLGLNLAKRHAELMGGSLKFTSEEGMGSEFTIYLPI